jgi:hypothetical protein
MMPGSFSPQRDSLNSSIKEPNDIGLKGKNKQETKPEKGKSQKTRKMGPKQKNKKVASPEDDNQRLLVPDQDGLNGFNEEDIPEESEGEEDVSDGQGSSYQKRIGFLAVLNQNAESKVREKV